MLKEWNREQISAFATFVGRDYIAKLRGVGRAKAQGIVQDWTTACKQGKEDVFLQDTQ